MRTISLRKKLIFSVISTLAILALIELGLGLAGVTPVTNLEDPFVGFSKHLPLMEPGVDDNGQEILSTAKGKLNWFNDQSFPRKKPENSYRIFCLGGSTTYGHPYWDPTSYSRWLRELLPIVDSSQQFEVINAGGISYASYRVASLMEELVRYEPDLFIVYTAHNEFLERRTYAAMFEQSSLSLALQATLAKTRLWAAMDQVLRGKLVRALSPADTKQAADILPGEVDEILNHTIGPIDYHRDPTWQSKVLNHYEFNLTRMVQLARQCGAEIVFLTPASNEKDCSPFKSEVDASVSDSDKQQLEMLLEQASYESEDDNTDEAMRLLRVALGIDEHYAATHYQIGRLEMSLGHYEAAGLAFRQALNDDVCPIRAVDGISAAIRRVGIGQKVPIVDFEKRLRDLCLQQQTHSVFGDEYFMDHVHPTVEVHQQLARWIIQDLQKDGVLKGKSLSDPNLYEAIATVVEKVNSEVDTRAYGIALRNLAKVLHWAGKFEEAAPRARDALDRIVDDPESRFVLADCLKNMGQIGEALDEYDRLFRSGRDFERAYHPYGDLLAKEGDFERAKAYLILAALREPKNSSIQYTLGIVHLQLGEYAFAVESLSESDRLFPDDPRTMYFLAQAKVGNNDPLGASLLFEKLLTQNFEPATVHYGLGMLCYEQDKMSEAIRHFESAIELDPTFEAALKYLELARAR